MPEGTPKPDPRDDRPDRPHPSDEDAPGRDDPSAAEERDSWWHLQAGPD